MHPITLGIRFALDIHRKINGAHGAVAEFFVNQLLESGAVNIHQFKAELRFIACLCFATLNL